MTPYTIEKKKKKKKVETPRRVELPQLNGNTGMRTNKYSRLINKIRP